jgi:hypothetical protein
MKMMHTNIQTRKNPSYAKNVLKQDTNQKEAKQFSIEYAHTV